METLEKKMFIPWSLLLFCFLIFYCCSSFSFRKSVYARVWENGVWLRAAASRQCQTHGLVLVGHDFVLEPPWVRVQTLFTHNSSLHSRAGPKVPPRPRPRSYIAKAHGVLRERREKRKWQIKDWPGLGILRQRWLPRTMTLFALGRTA